MNSSKYRSTRESMRSCSLITIVVVVGASAGCDRGMPMVKVGGVVKFDGGPCPSDGRLVFKPIDVPAGLPDRAGTAQFQKDGEFRVTSYDEGDGLLPGRYKVEITCLSGIPDFNDPKGYEKASYIAPGYEPEELVVEEGENQLDLVYDVPAKQGGSRNR